MSYIENTPLNQDAPEGAARDEYDAVHGRTIAVQAAPPPRTLTGLGPVEVSPAELEPEPPTLDALADTLRLRTRFRPTIPLPARATRVYQPPAVPPGPTPPNHRLRSVTIEPKDTVVKDQPELAEDAPATAPARRDAEAEERRDVSNSESRAAPSDAPWSTNSTSPPVPSKSRARTASFAFAASVVVTVAVLVLLLSPDKGRIFVTAAGPNNAPIAGAEVLVDGRRECAAVPCRIDATRGSHFVRVGAPGYQRTADHAVAVKAGQDSVVHINLARENSAAIDVRVDAAQGLRVTLDGTDHGPAPLVLRRLSPGSHTLRLVGNPLYAPFEQELRLEPDRVARIEPKLVPLKGVINVTPGIAALGARVEIVGAGVRHEIQKLPARVEVSSEGSYRLRATRTGYRDFETEINFADGTPEKEIHIDLAWDEAALDPARNAPARVSAVALEETSLPPPPESVGTGTLGANSIPISSVIVDGRPVGTTPVQITLPPGIHSVVFIHPTLGRRSMNVGVTSGKPAVAAVRF